MSDDMPASPKAPRSAEARKPAKAPKPPRQTAAEARAEAEAKAASEKSARDAALAEHFGGPPPGRAILRLSVGSTILFTIVTAIALIANTAATRWVLVVVNLTLFAFGMVLFVVALLLAAGRSRDDELTMAGWWFLTGTAPASVRSTLWGCVVAQLLVGLAGAVIRSLSIALAFGVLVPTLGLALCGLWGAKYGMFPERRVVAAPPVARRRTR